VITTAESQLLVGNLIMGDHQVAAAVPASVIWVLTTLVAVAWWVVLHRMKQRHYLGPKTWPVLGCILEQAAHFDVLHDWLLHYFKSLLTYSVPMMHINNTFTANPANVEWILKTNFDNYPKVLMTTNFLLHHNCTPHSFMLSSMFPMNPFSLHCSS
jgi:hypothetical protein